jgi:endonuclease YncB( thermonuclease family)
MNNNYSIVDCFVSCSRKVRGYAAVRIAVLASLVADGLGVTSSTAGERLSGPIRARVLRVLDGDTLKVSARIWIGQDVQTRVRLADIDAPELRGACPYERDLALRARAYLAARLESSDGRPVRVSLYDISLGKYGGRVLARVLTEKGENLGNSLLAAGLARPYGGGRRGSWCAASG